MRSKFRVLDQLRSNTTGAKRPQVQTDGEDLRCSRNVDVLKKGPVDWKEMIKAGRPFEDQDFKDVDAIYWNEYAAADFKQQIDAAYRSNTIFWQRWRNAYQDDQTKSLFGTSGSPHPNDINQGMIGTCYILASASATAGVE